MLDAEIGDDVHGGAVKSLFILSALPSGRGSGKRPREPRRQVDLLLLDQFDPHRLQVPGGVDERLPFGEAAAGSREVDHVGPETRLTNRFCDPVLAAQTYQEHLDEWSICEDLGFDGVLVNEHLQSGDLCAVVTATKRSEELSKAAG